MKSDRSLTELAVHFILFVACLFLIFIFKNELSLAYLIIFVVFVIFGCTSISLLLHHNFKLNRYVQHIQQKEEKQEIAAAYTKEMLAVIDLQGEIQSCSASHIRNIGAKSTITNFFQIIHQEDKKNAVALIQSTFSTKKALETEFRIKHKDGNWIDIELTVNPFHKEHSVTEYTLLIFRDITKRKKDVDKLFAAINNLQKIKFALDESSLLQIVDKHGIIIYANEKACQLSGYSFEELEGQPMRILNSHFHSKEFFADLWKTVLSGDVWQGEIRNKSKNGDFFWANTTIVPILDKSGQPFQFITIRTDITENKKNTKELEHLSNVDGLTSLYNRRYFDLMLQQYWEKLLETGQPISVIFFDMDSFKSFNDFYGHLMGDECLIQISKNVQELLDKDKTVLARYGGEEFCIILPGIDVNAAYLIAERIRSKIESLQIPHEKSGIYGYLTLSLGVATMVPTSDIGPCELINRADKALYKAKSHGRNIVVSNNDIVCTT